MAVETRKREGQQLLLRFPDGSDLRDRLDECARANSRSLTGEIIHRLEASLSGVEDKAGQNASPAVSRAEYDRLTSEVRAIQQRLMALEESKLF